jgi:hypothetical protein
VGRKTGGTKFGPGSPARIKFLEELKDTGRFYDSCQAAGVAYMTMQKFRDPQYDWFDPQFVEEVAEAIEAYTDKCRAEVHRRGVEGWVERGIFDKDGVELGQVHKYSDRLLELHIKKHDPGYREHVHVDARAAVATEGFITLLDDVRKLPRDLRDTLLKAQRGLKQLAESSTTPEGA